MLLSVSLIGGALFNITIVIYMLQKIGSLSYLQKKIKFFCRFCAICRKL